MLPVLYSTNALRDVRLLLVDKVLNAVFQRSGKANKCLVDIRLGLRHQNLHEIIHGVAMLGQCLCIFLRRGRMSDIDVLVRKIFLACLLDGFKLTDRGHVAAILG